MAPDLPRRFRLRQALLEPRHLLALDRPAAAHRPARSRPLCRRTNRRRCVTAAVFAAVVDDVARRLVGHVRRGVRRERARVGRRRHVRAVVGQDHLDVRPNRNARWTRKAWIAVRLFGSCLTPRASSVVDATLSTCGASKMSPRTRLRDARRLVLVPRLARCELDASARDAARCRRIAGSDSRATRTRGCPTSRRTDNARAHPADPGRQVAAIRRAIVLQISRQVEIRIFSPFG